MKIYDSLMIHAQKISFFWRVVLCVLFPPLAVFDKGCFAVSLVYLLTVIGLGTGALFGMFFFSFLVGWIPAGLVALLICAADNKQNPPAEIEPDRPPVRTVPMKLSFGDILILAGRYLLCCLAPPLAVLDKGCGAIVYVFFFTLCGLLPGIILAFLICLKSNNYYRKSITEHSHEA